MFFRSLKREILVFTLGLTILTIIAATAISVTSTKTAGEAASTSTGDVLRTQAAQYLSQIAQAAAQQQDLVFERMSDDTRTIAAYTAHLYEHPSFFASNAYWKFDQHITRTDGRYLNDPKDVSSVHIPSVSALTPEAKRDIELSADLDFIVPTILAHHSDAVALYAINTNGVTRYYPNIVLGSLAPPDYDPRPDIYYRPATPAENPEKKVVWSPLYDDVVGRGLMISVTAPVYAGNRFAGIVAADLLLANMINTITSYSPIEGSYAFLIDKDGRAIAFPDKAYEDILGRQRIPKEVRTDLASSTLSFQPVLEEMKSGKEGFSSFSTENGKGLFIAYAPLNHTGFSMAVVAEEEIMLKAVGTLHNEISGSIRDTIGFRIIPASLFIILISSIAGTVLVSRIVHPIQQLTLGVREIEKGNLGYDMKVRSENEIGELATSFNQMSKALLKSRQELFEYSQGLETKVEERTQELSYANQRQEALLHFISHEIKGYLTKGVGTLAGLIDGDYGHIDDHAKAFSTRALGEMRKGVATVMDILEASNLKKGTVTFTKHPFDLAAALERAVHDAQPSAAEKKLSLEFTKPSGTYLFEGDEEKIRNYVLGNLVDNAIRYTQSGSIRVELTRHEHSLRVVVSDTGIGITAEDMPRLFTEGGHGKDSIKMNVHSTGYGLFIAKQIVQEHNGRIWAESDGPGKGSRFIIEFPISPAQSPSPAAQA